MSRVYIYVVVRDFGFAPNPFHGVCTLATCKPAIRRRAQVGDWIIGMGGARLKAVGRCIFAMKITEVMSFDEYWTNLDYRAKRPVRNGSKKMMVGDNIYHHDTSSGQWKQADSHHSRPDGMADLSNQKRDTGADRVLASRYFLYFGRQAPTVPIVILDAICFKNRVGHYVYSHKECEDLLEWIDLSFHTEFNHVLGDPYDFGQSSARYSVHDNKIT